jgi:tripartite-type tricarboxylate transporter receptor subunit TctC
VASTPGGGTDIISRIIGDQLSKQLGQPFVIKNRPGAGSVTGTAFAANAAPDGYTLPTDLNASMAVNPSLFANLPYDPIRDFTPVGMLAEFPFVWWGRISRRIRSRNLSRSQNRARVRSITRRPATVPGSICRWSCSN